MKFGIITTTIHIPKLLIGYASNFRKYGWKDVFFVIAGDKKTPPEITSFCKKIEERYKYKFYYLDLDTQKDLDKALYKYVPLNCVQRRNFATLFAYKNGADVIITIDDDNFIGKSDYLKWHSIVGKEIELNCIRSNTEWFNVCETLEEVKNREFYHRGFPFNQRKKTRIKISRKKVKIVINEGLWLGAPDTDAVTWINLNDLKVMKFNSKKFGKNFVLEKGTWCPFNTQNTAIVREVIPTFFLNPNQKRYDDIWFSFILRKIADHLGHSISYGEPLVIQRRNVHNYLKDLVNEIDGMIRTPKMIEELRTIKLTGKDYYSCTKELIEKLSNNFDDLKEGYKIWLKSLRKN